MFDSNTTLHHRYALNKELEALSDAQFILGLVIKNLKGDFVADPFTGKKLIGDDPR
jgi:hypothetical protein